MEYLKKIILNAAIFGLFLTSCNKSSLQELNVNPQAANNVDLNFLFTSAQLGAASGGAHGNNRYLDWRSNIGLCSYAIQQLANTGGGISCGDKYVFGASDYEACYAPFEFSYEDLNSLAEIQKKSTSNGKYKNLLQATRILKVFLFARITDFYENVPYSEALKVDEGILFPKYDKQKDIYIDLLKELDEASVALKTPDPTDGFAKADIYYKGDISKWKKWGYSLMLRLAMRVSKVEPAMANTYVQKAVAGGVFTSNSDNVWCPMAEGPGLWTNQNGISRAFIPGDGGQPTWLSKYLINWLKGTDPSSTADDDPRLMIFSGGIGKLWPSDPASLPYITDPLLQKGMPNGQDQARLEAIEGIVPPAALNLLATYSRINPKLLERAESYMMMNYAEVELLLAEASVRGIGGLTPAVAKAHYENGVKGAMQMYIPYDASFAVSNTQVANYLAAYPYNGGLPMIYQQLWASKFMNWWEAWSDWRRTGYPQLVPINYPGNNTGGQIPQRAVYPPGEVGGNPNFAAGASKNDLTTKVWWAN